MKFLRIKYCWEKHQVSIGVQQQEVHRKGRCNAVNSQDPKFRIVQYAPVTPPSTLPKAQAHLRLQLHPCVADRLPDQISEFLLWRIVTAGFVLVQKRQMHNLCGSQMDLQSVWSYLVHSLHFDPEKKMSRKIAFSQCRSNGTSTYHCPTAAANALWAELAELASDQVIEGPSAPNFANLNDSTGDSSHQLFLGGTSAVGDVLTNEI